MRTAQIEMSLTLTKNAASNLQRLAQARGVTDSAVIEQALALLFDQEDFEHSQDFRLSLATMREDWDATPDDWMADEVQDGIPSW